MKDTILKYLFVVFNSLVIGVAIGAIIQLHLDNQQAIQHGYMQHNPVTGKVEWR